MKKDIVWIIALIAVIVMNLLTGCSEETKTEVTLNPNGEIIVEQIEVEEIQVEETQIQTWDTIEELGMLQSWGSF